VRIPDLFADRIPWILVVLVAGKMGSDRLWIWGFRHLVRSGSRALQWNRALFPLEKEV
jgi:hypothetical protein